MNRVLTNKYFLGGITAGTGTASIVVFHTYPIGPVFWVLFAMYLTAGVATALTAIDLPRLLAARPHDTDTDTTTAETAGETR